MIHSLTRSCVFCELQAHPFIASNDDGNVDMISMRVCCQLEQRRSCAQSMHSPNSESSWLHPHLALCIKNIHYFLAYFLSKYVLKKIFEINLWLPRFGTAFSHWDSNTRNTLPMVRWRKRPWSEIVFFGSVHHNFWRTSSLFTVVIA